ncbi:DASH complex, subunit Spc19 [Choiromyces venosus 120613-1]|uniref:DASH complex subunit SPC19 n=1 Tax=Choiromyces venosus 120613-1 TaxID=1336337 RepID=A0A3N4JTE9_9PEZI|nr:DASH complex, subunit Spc19 [Choiromyces venosus 120613-1]
MSFGTTSTIASLNGCVSSLQNSIRLLDSSISILDSGVHDFPRIKKVLQCTRHFELISEPTLYAAQTALADEIGPEVEHLLRRVEQHLAKMERREKALIAKSELQEGRLQQKPSLASSSSAASRQRKSGLGGNVQSAEKLRMLKGKKERLAHTIERLSLQAGHKERQLRMTMNYGAS